MSEQETLVREFCDAWPKRDVDLIMDFFTDDAVYHNMPLPPLAGKDAIRGFLDGLITGVASVEFRVLNLVGGGDVVMTERVDVFRMTDGREGAFAVMGVFEVRDGKIAAWRDYFDMAPVTAFLTGTS
jgi:limonene-1,2-epoxide hydrolase